MYVIWRIGLHSSDEHYTQVMSAPLQYVYVYGDVYGDSSSLFKISLVFFLKIQIRFECFWIFYEIEIIVTDILVTVKVIIKRLTGAAFSRLLESILNLDLQIIQFIFDC